METIADYLKQAQDFLDSTGTTFKATFIKYDIHFDGDKNKRDIYEITLKRGRRSYSFEYGQSLKDSGFFYTKGKQQFPLDRELMSKSYARLTMYIKSEIDFQFSNNKKSDRIHRPEKPTPYDVFTCLQKYDPNSFDDFCSNFRL